MTPEDTQHIWKIHEQSESNAIKAFKNGVVVGIMIGAAIGFFLAILFAIPVSP